VDKSERPVHPALAVRVVHYAEDQLRLRHGVRCSFPESAGYVREESRPRLCVPQPYLTRATALSSISG
jgi:hypothetical protein